MALNVSSMIQGPAFLHHALFQTSRSAMKFCSFAKTKNIRYVDILWYIYKSLQWNMQWFRTAYDIKWYQYIWGGRYKDLRWVDSGWMDSWSGRWKGIDVCLLWCSLIFQQSASGGSIAGHTPGCIRTVVQLVWTSGSHQWHQKVRRTAGESRQNLF